MSHPLRLRPTLGTLLPAFALLVAFRAAPARAATYSVTTLADNVLVDGLCSLREAIAVHNGTGGGGNDCGPYDKNPDRIVFSVLGTISLNPNLGELLLTAPELTIDGPGASGLTIHGNKMMAILTLDTLRPPVLTVRAVTLRNGLGSALTPGGNALAGGIRMNNLGSSVYGPPTTIVVEDAVLFANSAPMLPPDQGGFPSYAGAISSFGSLVLRRTQVRANQSDTGAVYHVGPALIEDCDFDSNLGTSLGAALVLRPSGPWTVRRTLFRHNSDQGTIENCTFVDNNTSTGTVLGLQGKVRVRSSTFSGNGIGAIFLGGVVEFYGSSLELTSSLFAANTRPDLVDGETGSVPLKVAYNLFETPALALPPSVACAASTFNDKNLCGITSPGLAPLGSYGGLTPTMPLFGGSPALDAGSNPGGLTTDQRGTGYPRSYGAGTDIGAFESQGSSFGTSKP
jgi:CSLREA domain-containing protein